MKIVSQIASSKLLNNPADRVDLSRFKFDYFLEKHASRSKSRHFLFPWTSACNPDAPEELHEQNFDVEIGLSAPTFNPFDGYYTDSTTKDGSLCIDARGKLTKPVQNDDSESDSETEAQLKHQRGEKSGYSAKFNADAIIATYIQYCDGLVEAAIFPDKKALSVKNQPAIPNHVRQWQAMIDRSAQESDSVPQRRIPRAGETKPGSARRLSLENRKRKHCKIAVAPQEDSSSESDHESKSVQSQSSQDDETSDTPPPRIDKGRVAIVKSVNCKVKRAKIQRSKSLSMGRRAAPPKCKYGKSGCKSTHSLSGFNDAQVKAMEKLLQKFCEEEHKAKLRGDELQQLCTQHGKETITYRDLAKFVAAKFCKTLPSGRATYHNLRLRERSDDS